MTKIFISYQRESEGEARELYDRLTDAGFDVWQDVRNIRHTDQWSQAINTAVNDCDRLVLLMTPKAMESREVYNEWFYFYSEKKPLHCLYTSDCKVHYQLKPFQYLDWRTANNRQWERLIGELREEVSYNHYDKIVVSEYAPPRTVQESLDALQTSLTHTDKAIALTEAQITELTKHKPHTPAEQRLTAIAQWSLPRYALDNRFVRLTVLIKDEQRGYIEADQQRQYNDLRDILAERLTEVAFVLLGDPGGGKSTLLRRLQLDDAIDRLRDNAPRLSLFASLGEYKAENAQDPLPSPKVWLEAQWTEKYPHLPPLATFLKTGQLLFLLDALNEMPHSDASDYAKKVDMWRDFIGDIYAQHPDNRAIFTCRSLDYSTSLSVKDRPELAVPHIKIQPMDDDKVREFLTVYVPDHADNLWGQLDGTKELEIYRTPYFLRLLIDMVGMGGVIPKDKSALFTGFVRSSLKREIDGRNPLLHPNTLLDKDDIRQINQADWDTVYELPTGGILCDKLTLLAYAMQKQFRATDNKQVKIHEKDAKGIINHGRDADILEVGVALNVLDKQSRKISYFHQLLQEYFAARTLARDFDPALITSEWQADKVSPSLEETLKDLPMNDPLPPLPQTGWEETTILAVAMSQDPDAFIRQVLAVNVPLAGRCVVAVKHRITPKTISDIQQALITRTQDISADLRARISAGLVLGTVGDPRFTRKTGEQGAYLLPPLITISGGTYPIGDDDAPYDREKPAHTVPLESFSITQFPVTNAEYALFIEAGGYEDEQWWDTEEAQKWRRGEGTADGQKAGWRETRGLLKNWTEAGIMGLVDQNKITSKQAEDYITVKNWSEERFEGWLDEQFPSGERYTQPRYWDDADFNNPAQPVVGITWYEARAYCAWLSAQTGQIFGLPTEVQYEAATRGKEGRKYAYGNTFEPFWGNTFETHIRKTTPIGVFPQGKTPEGIYDLTGNVYSWTTTIYEDFRYPYQLDDRENLNSINKRVMRGGSWFSNTDFARASYRYDLNPNIRNLSIGFFVVCRPY
ncbi:MAG: SUMF1/EgtB/PvdO family nonheme iron enzyme [bacterium]|nr:SUMF1/EgtB/PvdO family nonheme iron enzyme [bacterium]